MTDNHVNEIDKCVAYIFNITPTETFTRKILEEQTEFSTHTVKKGVLKAIDKGYIKKISKIKNEDVFVRIARYEQIEKDPSIITSKYSANDISRGFNEYVSKWASCEKKSAKWEKPEALEELIEKSTQTIEKSAQIMEQFLQCLAHKGTIVIYRD